MMTHVVIFYLLTVVLPGGLVETHKYASYRACDQVRQVYLQQKQKYGTPLDAQCVPQQETRPSSG
jgi:hypothetical protein